MSFPYLALLKICFFPNLLEPEPDCSTCNCTTSHGPDANKPCVFPFKFNGVVERCCTTRGDASNGAWCSTKVDDEGNHIGGQGNWGNCESKCQPENIGE